MFLFAEVGHENIVAALLDFRSNLLNWILLIGLLIWAIKKYLPSFIAQRQQSINNELELAIKTRKEAELALAGQKEKIEKAEQEAEQIVLEAKQAAARMSEDLKQQTETDIAELRKKFEMAAHNEKQAAILEMRSIVAKAAIKLTEENLRSNLTENNKTKIAHEFMGELSKIGSSSMNDESVNSRNDHDHQKVANA